MIVLRSGSRSRALRTLPRWRRCGDDRRRPAVGHARHEGVFAERRKQRLDDGPGLQDAQEPDVELRHLVEEQAHAIERADAHVAAQEVRPAVGQLLQVAEGELPDLAPVALVDEGQAIAQPRLDVAVHADLGDVDRLALAVAQLTLG